MPGRWRGSNTAVRNSKPGRTDGKGYTLEAAIPWKSIPGVEPSTGEPLRLRWEISWSDALGGEHAFERTWGQSRDKRAAKQEGNTCFVLE